MLRLVFFYQLLTFLQLSDAAALKRGEYGDYSNGLDGQNETGVKFVTVLLPNEVKTLPVPSWLGSWEDAEVGGPEGNFNRPLGDDKGDLRLRAAYWLMSISGGNWLSSNLVVNATSESAMDEVAMTYLENGDQEQMRAKLAEYSLINDP